MDENHRKELSGSPFSTLTTQYKDGPLSIERSAHTKHRTPPVLFSSNPTRDPPVFGSKELDDTFAAPAVQSPSGANWPKTYHGMLMIPLQLHAYDAAVHHFRGHLDFSVAVWHICFFSLAMQSSPTAERWFVEGYRAHVYFYTLVTLVMKDHNHQDQSFRCTKVLACSSG